MHWEVKYELGIPFFTFTISGMQRWNTSCCPLKTKSFFLYRFFCACLHPVLTCWTNNKYVMVYRDQVSWENLYWTFQMVAEGCTIAREEPTSCNHDNYGCCKVPSAAFHLDLDIHDLLLHKMLRNKYTRSPLLQHMVWYKTVVIMGCYTMH